MSTRKNTPIRPPGAGPEGNPFGPTAALLALAAVSTEPPATVKERLLARIRATSTRPSMTEPASLTGWRFDSVRAVEGWRSAPFPGVRVKTLSVDETRDMVLLLMEMAPGSRIPDHPHLDVEEGILLSGDAINGGRHMYAGDYYHAGAGTLHTDTSSPGGCVALIRLTLRSWNVWRAPQPGG